jgi:hypothetical protein
VRTVDYCGLREREEEKGALDSERSLLPERPITVPCPIDSRQRSRGTTGSRLPSRHIERWALENVACSRDAQKGLPTYLGNNLKPTGPIKER